MVAMVIGMLGIIVMMQVFGVFESQKRTTTGGDDAISSGAISLYGIQREMQQSGWGVSNVQLIGCSVSGLFAWDATVAIPLAPVTIYPSQGAAVATPAGYPVIPDPDANTDILLVVSGNGNATVEGNNIESLPAANVYAVNGAADFSPAQAGPPALVADRVVGVPRARPTPCALASSTVSAAVVGPNVTVAAGFAGITNGDRLFNLGKAPTVRFYAIRNQNLTVCDFMATDCRADLTGLSVADTDAIWVPIAHNVVSLRAEYGRDAASAVPLPPSGIAMSGVVNRWDQTAPVPASPYAAKNTQACGLVRVAAVRLALVARSSQPEKPLAGGAPVTAAARAWTDLLWMGSDDAAHTADATEAANVAIDLSQSIFPVPTAWPQWQDFRYKVFQTVVPLRNITSQGAVPEC
jgi:type IV pilus assembly protein PilW